MKNNDIWNRIFEEKWAVKPEKSNVPNIWDIIFFERYYGGKLCNSKQ